MRNVLYYLKDGKLIEFLMFTFDDVYRFYPLFTQPFFYYFLNDVLSVWTDGFVLIWPVGFCSSHLCENYFIVKRIFFFTSILARD